MLYAEALQYLLSLGHETLAMKLGLANTERLLEALGQPQKAFRKVQIAGTNGKGSSAVMLYEIVRAAGINAALYTSPHLVNITERMRFNGQEIQPQYFAELTAKVRKVSTELRDAGVIPALPTFFEHLTVMFLLACSEMKMELVILETGLGGRLDATTAAGAEIVAISPVALDHQEYLGNTLADIAAEKAAIIRTGVESVVVAPQQPEALAVIKQRAALCEVSMRLNDCRVEVRGAEQDGRLRATFKTSEDVYENVLLGLRGRHQATNACVATGLAEALRQSGFAIKRADIISGLERARHAGRLEIREGQPRILFDGAHNVAGARALRDYLDEFVQTPLTLVFGAMRDKELAEIAAILFPAARRLILAEPASPRAATLEMLVDALPHDYASQTEVTLAKSLREALSHAREQTPRDELICVTGSLYLVGEAQSLLLSPARESD
jgi:dihydrofolate synthase/folylpolyglutamate synthase